MYGVHEQYQSFDDLWAAIEGASASIEQSEVLNLTQSVDCQLEKVLVNRTTHFSTIWDQSYVL